MHIAIIEDERKLAMSLKAGLESEGYTITLFQDGLSAEKELINHFDKYDAAMLDLVLPKQSGFELCRKLRAADINLPILVITARDTTEDKVHALDSGADDLITKPFAFEELLARIRALLRRPHEVLPTSLSVGDLIVNPATYEVKRGKAKIPLTLKEFELLVYLLRNKNKAISREDLFNHIWNFSDGALSNLVDVHIRNLRKKLDDPYTKKYIQTVRGIGYIIKV